MKKMIRTGRFLAVIVLSAAWLHAAPIPVLNIPALVEKADVVAIGSVVFVADAGPATIDTPSGPIQARLMTGELLVEEIVKGTAGLSSIRFQFRLPEVAMGYRGVASGTHRVLFLANRGDHFEFVSPYHPSVIATPGVRLSSAEPAQRVIEAVAAVLRSGAASTEQKREALNALRGSTTPRALSALRAAMHDGDREIQLNAAATLLAVNDVSALAVAEAALLAPQPNLPAETALNLRGAIAQGLKAEAAVPTLARLLRSPDPRTRVAAITALGRTRSAAAVRPLVRALDDPVADVRLGAVRGLAEISGRREGIPSAEAFRADEQRYIRYWKEWAAQLWVQHHLGVGSS